MTTTQTEPTSLPYEVAADTFVVPWHLHAPPVGYFCMNSLVVRGAEPVIVDTGSPATASSGSTTSSAWWSPTTCGGSS